MTIAISLFAIALGAVLQSGNGIGPLTGTPLSLVVLVFIIGFFIPLFWIIGAVIPPTRPRMA